MKELHDIVRKDEEVQQKKSEQVYCVEDAEKVIFDIKTAVNKIK